MTGRTLVQLARNAFLSATLNGRALFTWDIWSRGRRRPIVVSAPPTRREAILRVWCSLRRIKSVRILWLAATCPATLVG
jgi:hypothetical protein